MFEGEIKHTKIGLKAFQGINQKLLKPSSPYKSYYSLFIFSSCTIKFEFPELWTNVHVQPQFEKGNNLDVTNIRAFAITNALNFWSELLVYKQFGGLFCGQLCEQQHGYRKRTQQLLDL